MKPTRLSRSIALCAPRNAVNYLHLRPVVHPKLQLPKRPCTLGRAAANRAWIVCGIWPFRRRRKGNISISSEQPVQATFKKTPDGNCLVLELRVGAGDTIESLAAQYALPAFKILEANAGKVQLREGTVLRFAVNMVDLLTAAGSDMPEPKLVEDENAVYTSVEEDEAQPVVAGPTPLWRQSGQEEAKMDEAQQQVDALGEDRREQRAEASSVSTETSSTASPGHTQQHEAYVEQHPFIHLAYTARYLGGLGLKLSGVGLLALLVGAKLLSNRDASGSPRMVEPDKPPTPLRQRAAAAGPTAAELAALSMSRGSFGAGTSAGTVARRGAVRGPEANGGSRPVEDSSSPAAGSAEQDNIGAASVAGPHLESDENNELAERLAGHAQASASNAVPEKFESAVLNQQPDATVEPPHLPFSHNGSVAAAPGPGGAGVTERPDAGQQAAISGSGERVPELVADAASLQRGVESLVDEVSPSAATRAGKTFEPRQHSQPTQVAEAALAVEHPTALPHDPVPLDVPSWLSLEHVWCYTMPEGQLPAYDLAPRLPLDPRSSTSSPTEELFCVLIFEAEQDMQDLIKCKTRLKLTGPLQPHSYQPYVMLALSAEMQLPIGFIPQGVLKLDGGLTPNSLRERLARAAQVLQSQHAALLVAEADAAVAQQLEETEQGGRLGHPKIPLQQQRLRDAESSGQRGTFSDGDVLAATWHEGVITPQDSVPQRGASPAVRNESGASRTPSAANGAQPPSRRDSEYANMLQAGPSAPQTSKLLKRKWASTARASSQAPGQPPPREGVPSAVRVDPASSSGNRPPVQLSGRSAADSTTASAADEVLQTDGKLTPEQQAVRAEAIKRLAEEHRRRADFFAGMFRRRKGQPGSATTDAAASSGQRATDGVDPSVSADAVMQPPRPPGTEGASPGDGAAGTRRSGSGEADQKVTYYADTGTTVYWPTKGPRAGDYARLKDELGKHSVPEEEAQEALAQEAWPGREEFRQAWAADGGGVTHHMLDIGDMAGLEDSLRDSDKGTSTDHQRPDQQMPPFQDSGWWRGLPMVYVPVVRYANGSVAFVMADMANTADSTNNHVLGFEDRSDAGQLVALVNSWDELRSNGPPSAVQVEHYSPEELQADLDNNSMKAAIFRKHSLPVRPGMSINELSTMAYNIAQMQH